MQPAAVLFDWNDTLVHFEWDEERVVEGHRAALGRDDAAFTARWRDVVTGDHGYRPYAELLRELGVEDPDRFIDAEHEAWRPAHTVLASAQALLEALRSRGIKTGVVANAWPDPARILRADVEAFGLAPLLEVLLFAEDAALRKPEPELFLRACRELDVDPSDVVFVGDDLAADIEGASSVGMTTVQALWFHADDAMGIEPDTMAFTPMDVLNFVSRLAL